MRLTIRAALPRCSERGKAAFVCFLPLYLFPKPVRYPFAVADKRK